MHKYSRADNSPQRCNNCRNTICIMQMVFANCTAKKLVNPSTTIRSTCHNSRVRGGRQSFPSLQQEGPVCPAPGLVWALQQPSPLARNQSTILFPQALYKKNPHTKYFPLSTSPEQIQHVQRSPSQTPAVSDEAPPPGRSGVYRAASAF